MIKGSAHNLANLLRNTVLLCSIFPYSLFKTDIFPYFVIHDIGFITKQMTITLTRLKTYVQLKQIN